MVWVESKQIKSENTSSHGDEIYCERRQWQHQNEYNVLLVMNRDRDDGRAAAALWLLSIYYCLCF